MEIIAKKNILMLVISVIFGSCVMDRKTTLYIKNCTKDTLLIELSGADSLINWHFGDNKGKGTIIPNDTNKVETIFHKDIIGSLALPDSIIYVDPYIYNQHDTCYIYAIKWDIAKHYSIEEIRIKKLYDRQAVTKKDFNNRRLEYRI